MLVVAETIFYYWSAGVGTLDLVPCILENNYRLWIVRYFLSNFSNSSEKERLKQKKGRSSHYIICGSNSYSLLLSKHGERQQAKENTSYY